MPEYGTTTPAAGWYPDPANATLERWWGGVEWTETTRPIPIAPPVGVPDLAAVPGGGLNPFATEKAPSWGAAAPAVAAPAQGFGGFAADPFLAATTPTATVAPGWYDKKSQPPENGAAKVSLGFGIASWFFNPLLIFSVVGLRSAKRGLENAQMLEYERREPVGRSMAKAGRVLSVLSLIGGILTYATMGFAAYSLFIYHDYVIEGVFASQANAMGVPGATLDCPTVGSYDPGSVMDCTATLPDGTSVVLRVTINDFWARDITVEPAT